MTLKADHTLWTNDGTVDYPRWKVEAVARGKCDRLTGMELEGNGTRDDIEDLVIVMDVRCIAITRTIRPAIDGESFGDEGREQFRLAWGYALRPPCDENLFTHSISPQLQPCCRDGPRLRRAKRSA